MNTVQRTHVITVSSTRSSEVIEKTITDADTLVTIHAEADTEATVSIVFDPPASCTAQLKVIVDKGAKLTVLCMQTARSNTVTLKQTTSIADDGHLYLQNITLGSDIEQSVQSELCGSKAVSDIDWIFYATKEDQQRLSARNIFTGSHGGGEMTLKGVAQDTAHVFCNGMIDIGPNGSGTDTYLTEDVLMLDGTAKVDAIPGLEIKTNDVKASHSATVSKVTPADLFYFASRGIEEHEARQMYVQGFLGDVTKKIQDEALRERVLCAIGEKCSC